MRHEPGSRYGENRDRRLKRIPTRAGWPVFLAPPFRLSVSTLLLLKKGEDLPIWRELR